MASYEELYRLTQLENPGSAKLWRQAYWAVLVAARDIRNEAAETVNHTNRLAWAVEAEADPTSKVRQMQVRILENATIAADPEAATDNDVQYVVNSLLGYVIPEVS
jgi:hypothetical protein